MQLSPLKFVVSVAFVALTSSCTIFRESTNPNASVLHFDNYAGTRRIQEDGVLSIAVRNVDDNFVGLNRLAKNKLTLDPGIRKLTITGSCSPPQASKLTLSVDLKPNTSYYITGENHGDIHEFFIKSKSGFVVVRGRTEKIERYDVPVVLVIR